jgi:hypothetical protein
MLKPMALQRTAIRCGGVKRHDAVLYKWLATVTFECGPNGRLADYVRPLAVRRATWRCRGRKASGCHAKRPESKGELLSDALENPRQRVQ